ncbi:MAG TPA: phosphotransferase, partial [Candidatus Angelobacter sp.]|nr:phosphotransferase [Candidatus Angelobacter sp.]
MAETVLEQILDDLRSQAMTHYPQRSEFKNLRVVGHTPKNDHFIYDVCVDFADGSERVAVKIYRPGRSNGNAKSVARQENANLQYVNQTLTAKRKLDGVPRVLGDYSELCAVVTDKVAGLPVQSIIMKAALLPGFADNGSIALVAQRAGEWLRSFHRSTADAPEAFDSSALINSLEKLCKSCQAEGLDDDAIELIMNGAQSALPRNRKTLPSSAVLCDFTPLNVVVTEKGVGFCDFARMKRRGNSFEDLATFLASVEALEKYPFCNRSITAQIQDNFLDSYNVSQSDAAILRVFKMKAL